MMIRRQSPLVLGKTAKTASVKERSVSRRVAPVQTVRIESVLEMIVNPQDALGPTVIRAIVRGRIVKIMGVLARTAINNPGAVSDHCVFLGAVWAHSAPVLTSSVLGFTAAWYLARAQVARTVSALARAA